MAKQYVKLADGRVIELDVPNDFDELDEEAQTTFLKGARDQYLAQEAAAKRSGRAETNATPQPNAAQAEAAPPSNRQGTDQPWWKDFGQGLVTSYTDLLDMIGKGTQLQSAMEGVTFRPGEESTRNFEAAREAVRGGGAPVTDAARSTLGMDGTIEDPGDRFASGLGGYFAPGFGALKGMKTVGGAGRELLTAVLSGAGNEAGFQLGEGMGGLGQTAMQIGGSALGGAAGYGLGNFRQFGPGGGNVADAAYAAFGDVSTEDLIAANQFRANAAETGVDLTLAQTLAGRGAAAGPATNYIAGTPEGSSVATILNQQPNQIDQLGQELAQKLAPDPGASQAIRNNMFNTVRGGFNRVGNEAADIDFINNRDAFAAYLEQKATGVKDIPPQREIPVRRRPGTGPQGPYPAGRTPVELAVLGRDRSTPPPVLAPRPAEFGGEAQQALDLPNPARSQLRQALTAFAVQTRRAKNPAELDAMIERELAQLEEQKMPPTVPMRGGDRAPANRLSPTVRALFAEVLDGPVGRGTAESAGKARARAQQDFMQNTPAGQILKDGPYQAKSEGGGNFGAMMQGAGAQGKNPITALYAQITELGGRDALNAYVVDWLTGKLKKTGRRVGGSPERNAAGELRMTGGQAEHSTVTNIVENLWRDDAQKDNVIAALEGLWTTQGVDNKQAREAATGFTEFLMLADIASRESGKVGLRTSEMEGIISKTWLQHFANFNALAPLRQPARAYVRNMTSRNREEFARLITDPEMFPLLVELSRTPRGKISKIADIFNRIVPASNMALQSNENYVEEDQ